MSAAASIATIPIGVALGGRAMTFAIDPRPAPHAWFALGMRKSGSSIFSSIVNALAIDNAINTVDVPGRMFREGLRLADWNGDRGLVDLLWRGNLYIGFRDPPTAAFDDPVFREARKILLVRDPRDVLVSEYFSNAYSHALPERDAAGSVVAHERARALDSEIDAYALDRVGHLDRTMAGYVGLLGDPALLVLRYEDVVFDKPGWIAAIARHFGWRTSPGLVEAILGWADVRPDQEDAAAFVRRVTPGDHREKLPPAAIGAIDRALAGFWRDFGYEIGQ